MEEPAILQIKEIERLQKYKTKRIIDFKSLMDGGLIIQESQPLKIKGKGDLKPAETTYKGETYKVTRAPTERSWRTCSSAGTWSRASAPIRPFS